MTVHAGEVVLVDALVEAANVKAAKAEALRLAGKFLTVAATPAAREDLMQVRKVIRSRGRSVGSKHRRH